MLAPTPENCIICKKYKEFRKNACELPPEFIDQFYATLRVKTFKRGEKTPMFDVPIWEAKIQYCPRCGTKWQVPRRRRLPEEMRRKK